jgi:hypothetical protein
MVLTGLFFGICASLLYLGLFASVLESSLLFIKIAVGFMLLVVVLATISAPYTYAACQVTEEGLFLPEHSQGYAPTGTADVVIVLVILPFVILDAAFLPRRYFKLSWDCIQQVSIQRTFWGETLIFEVSEGKEMKRHAISWPLADITGFQTAVFGKAPKNHPLSQFMQAMTKTAEQ